MPTVLTILNSGTMSNRNARNTVGDLSRKLSGTEERDWIINAGPGSATQTANAAKGRAESREPGTVNPVFGDKQPHVPGVFDFRQYQELPHRKKRADVLGRPFMPGIRHGWGWDHNVVRSVAWVEQHVIESMITGAGRVHTVNLVGWSRGAVTCHMIANALAGYTSTEDPRVGAHIRSLSVNIFAFDPVPGGGDKEYYGQFDKNSLPPQVRNYTGVFAEDEKRRIFKPVIPTAQKSNAPADPRHPIEGIWHIRMPGTHSTILTTGGALSEAQEICEHLCHGFLLAHGSEIPRTQVTRYTEDELIEKYGQLRLGTEEYRKKKTGLGERAKNKLLFQGTAKRDKELPTRKASDVAYVNFHHEALFKAHYPELHRLFIGTGKMGQAFYEEGRRLQTQAPAMFEVFQTYVNA